jgi:hypothetical protein
MAFNTALEKEGRVRMLSQATNTVTRDLTDVELMTDRTALECLSDEFRAKGSIMVCHLCDDVSELIVGIMVLRASEEAWVLCGPCLRKIPMQGTLAS